MSMKWTEKQIQSLVKVVFDAWKEQDLIHFKKSEEDVFKRAIQLIEEEFDKERQVEREANQMMDKLEKENATSFQRYKMFPLLKKRLAKEKGVIL